MFSRSSYPRDFSPGGHVRLIRLDRLVFACNSKSPTDDTLDEPGLDVAGQAGTVPPIRATELA